VYQVVRQTPNVQNGGTQILFNPGHRMSFANTGLFAQAIVRPPQNVGLTAGMRYDWNERFGNSFNPRLAIVLQALPSLYVKGLYGTSFVPPTPVQLYAVPLRFDGGVQGNRPAQESRAKTAGVAGWLQSQGLSGRGSQWFLHRESPIASSSWRPAMRMTAANLTTSHSWGFELASYLNRKPVFARLAARTKALRRRYPARRPVVETASMRQTVPVALNH